MTKLMIALAVLVSPAVGQGVDHGARPIGRRYHIDDRWVSVGPEWPRTEYLANEERVRGGVFDQRAADILNAAETFTRSVFTFSDMERRSAATYEQRFSGKERCGSTSDTLIVEWSVTGRVGTGTLILDDDPYASVYTLRIPRGAILSYEDLILFLDGIIVPKKPPLNLDLTKIDFTIPPPPVVFGFLGQTFRSPTGTVDVMITGAIREGYCYLLVRIGKGLTRDIYPMPPFIPERFPPLADQVRDWSFGRVRSEVGQEGCSEERDRTLVAELVKRGLSQDEFVDLLVHTRTGDSEALWNRVIYTVDALRAAGKLAPVDGYVEAALDAYEGVGPHADTASSWLLNVITFRCPAGFEAMALKHSKGSLPAGPITYLGRCSTSPHVLSTLESLHVPDSAEALRAEAVKSIRQRLEKGGEGK